MLASYLSRKFLITLLAIILLAHVWATFTSAYFFVWWLDIVMHFAGGLWVGMVALFFLRNISVEGIVSFLLILGSVALVGIFWEFFEFTLNQIWKNLGYAAFLQPSLEDTLSDILFDLVGGMAAFMIFKDRKKRV